VSHVGCGVEKGDQLGEGMRPLACEETGGGQFSMLDQNGVRFVPCNDVATPSKGILHLTTSNMILSAVYIYI
jgi:hypothetical protein